MLAGPAHALATSARPALALAGPPLPHRPADPAHALASHAHPVHPGPAYALALSASPAAAIMT